MKINKNGLELIKRWEGLELKAYKCPADVWTIGYGSTGAHVTKGLVITKEDAEKLLLKDLERFEKGVTDLVKVPLTDNQFAALVAFSFNVGVEALKKSTLLKKLNASDYDGASKEFAKWNKAGGKVLKGLVSRRAAESALFQTK